ncbi:MAG TPA: SDR family oxidoreductase [Gemmataceae bacterium]|nr:SDR family oxidoreductase [Gemmataceae bacterium]
MMLQGRSAIITGANQGLGQALAHRFVTAGASVLLVARGAERLRQVEAELAPLATAPGQVVASFAADVSKPENCEAVIERAWEVLPSLTALVNNAGIYGPMGPVEDNDWEAWAEAVRVNLFGTVLMCRAVVPHLRGQNYGKIINLSGGGATAPLPRMSAYAASKAAVVRFTETLAEEVRDAHIDVNAIAPGALNTRLLDQVLAAGPEAVGRAFYEKSLKQRDDGGVPPEKGAALAAFLASAHSDGITGRLLSAVWDDWEALPGRQQRLARSDIYTLRRIVPEDRGEKWQCA